MTKEEFILQHVSRVFAVAKEHKKLTRDAEAAAMEARGLWHVVQDMRERAKI